MVSRVKVEIKMTSWCVAGLRRVITDLSGRSASVGTIDAALNQLEIVYRELVAMDALGELDDNGVSALGFTGHAIEQVRHILQSPQRVCSHAYFSPLVHDGTVGRPRYDVPVSTLESLVYSGFTGPQIAEILCLSVRTVRRRMAEYGISIRATYTTLSDEELDSIVGRIQREFGLCGNWQMQGHLRAQGLRVQQSRVRESQRRVDPGGSIMRRLSSIHRRVYRVNGPLALWHMDGNHKLIR